MAWGLFRRRNPLLPILAFALCAGGLFAINFAISGEWNYQGGDRTTYTFEFPFQNEVAKPEVGAPKSREGVLADIIFNPRTFTSNLTHNLEYFFVGRHAGMLGYLFPGLFAIAALLAAPKRRPGWQWLVLASALAQGLVFVVATPYTWSGGGVGNRYFFSGYGVMLFLLPPIESLALAFAPWAIGALFVAPMVLNPFVASFRPSENAKSGPLRLFPVELTLLNDLPVNTDPSAPGCGSATPDRRDRASSSISSTTTPTAEADRSFWTRGESRRIHRKADRPIRRALFTMTAGPVPADVGIAIAGRKQSLHLGPNETQQVTFAMPAGFPYEKEVRQLLWHTTISTSSGFTPVFYDPASTDARYLGVRVKPVLEARPE